MDKLNFLDYLILDDIRQYGVLRDVELSRQLGCPRGLLLDRLELLCQAGYVQPAGSEYRLTREGQEQCVPLNYFHAPAASAPQTEEEFDWTPLYLPQPGWLDE